MIFGKDRIALPVHTNLVFGSDRLVKNIRRATRKCHSSEEKIRIVLDGLRGESSIAELCRPKSISPE
jgi:hypothetical protein